MTESEARWCRGIRGATTIEHNTKEEVLAATRELLERLIAANDIVQDDVACAFFTTTPDVDAEFPAVAARQLGWTQQALLCGHEMSVPGSLQRCIRILILLNTTKTASEIKHIYLKKAVTLRQPETVAPGGFKLAP